MSYNSDLQSNNVDLQGILDAVNALPEAKSDPVLQSKTVTPTTSSQTVTPDSGYDGLDKVTVNAIPTATQATPSITVSSTGLITAKSTQTAGYVAAGTKSATKQLTTQAAKTITPSTSSQTAVASGRYTTGTVTVKGDSNLVASNIKSGVSIFGVAGSYEGSGGGASIETCTVTVSFTCKLETPTLYYIDNNMSLRSITTNATITVIKNSIVSVKSTGQDSYCYGDCEMIFSTYGDEAIFVTGDCSIELCD